MRRRATPDHARPASRRRAGLREKGSEFERAVVQLFRLHGWLVSHARPIRGADGHYRTPLQGDKGAPDLLMAHPVHGHLLVELKAGTGRLEPEQQTWRRVLEQGGAPYRLWRPEDWLLMEAVARRGPSLHDLGEARA